MFIEEWDHIQPINAGWYKGILLAARENYLHGLIEDLQDRGAAHVRDGIEIEFLHTA